MPDRPAAARKPRPQAGHTPAKKATRKTARPAMARDKPASRKVAPRKAAPSKTAARKAPATAPPPAAARKAPAPKPPADSWIVLADKQADPSDPWTKPGAGQPTWEVLDDATQAAAKVSVPASTGQPRPSETGMAWLPAIETAPATDAGLPPDARKHSTGATLWTVLLILDLVFLGLNALIAVYAGIVLVFAPHSGLADTFRKDVAIGSPGDLLLETLASFLLFGVIPFLWLLGTRVRPWEGTRRFLQLHTEGNTVVRGLLLAVALLLSVAALSALFTLATKGIDGLTHPDEGENPAVQAILDNLSWPLALVVAACAGVGEEVFFRGVLRRWIGIWGQGILFGLAHAAGGYPPQVLFAFGMGILFGYLMKRGWSLWSLMIAHGMYDLTLLALGLASK